jgi:hypothetical protein
MTEGKAVRSCGLLVSDFTGDFPDRSIGSKHYGLFVG